MSPQIPQHASLQLFTKDALFKGRPALLQCFQIGRHTFVVEKRAGKTVRLEDETYDELDNPETVLSLLRTSGNLHADIFTFVQRLPRTAPAYPYYMELEELAALQIITYEHWWSKQIGKTTRNMVRKSQKAGVEIREAEYDDEFVRGMTAIFNESPVRQGKPFWHYGKDFETVRKQFSRHLHREDLLGAYYRDELVGFAMLGYTGPYVELTEIIAKIEHREKAIANALIAKTVEICARKQLPYLVYGYWGDDSLTDFKRHCGFERVGLPRYFVPVSVKGTIALKAGLHKGWTGLLPRQIKRSLKKLRSYWYGRAGSKRT